MRAVVSASVRLGCRVRLRRVSVSGSVWFVVKGILRSRGDTAFAGDWGGVLVGQGQLAGRDARLTVSVPGELMPLLDWLRRAPGVRVELVGGRPAVGELGIGDVLQISSAVGGAAAGVLLAMRTLPEFIRSRRSDVKVTVTTADREVVLEVNNVEDVKPILDRMFDDR